MASVWAELKLRNVVKAQGRWVLGSRRRWRYVRRTRPRLGVDTHQAADRLVIDTGEGRLRARPQPKEPYAE